MKKALVVGGICRGWKATPCMWGLIIKLWNKDPYSTTKDGFVRGLSDVFSGWDRGASEIEAFPVAWLCNLKLKIETFLREVFRISTCAFWLQQNVPLSTYEETGWCFFFQQTRRSGMFQQVELPLRGVVDMFPHWNVEQKPEAMGV